MLAVQGRCFTFTAVMQGTKTSAESLVIANCIALLVCSRTVSKFTSVLQPDIISHNLNLESEPKPQKWRRITIVIKKTNNHAKSGMLHNLKGNSGRL